jgi:hypothetical protein
MNRLLLHACAAKVARFKEWIDGKAKKYNIENIINIFFKFCSNPTKLDHAMRMVLQFQMFLSANMI